MLERVRSDCASCLRLIGGASVVEARWETHVAGRESDRTGNAGTESFGGRHKHCMVADCMAQDYEIASVHFAISGH